MTFSKSIFYNGDKFIHVTLDIDIFMINVTIDIELYKLLNAKLKLF